MTDNNRKLRPIDDTKAMVIDQTPRPVGRPTAYKPEYCQLVMELGQKGKSKTAIAATIGVTRQSMENWAETHKDFFDALTRAKELEQLWWEEAGQQGMLLQGFGGSVWSRSMAARFPHEWRETTRQEQTGANGGAIRTESRVINVIGVEPKKADGE